MDEQESDLNIEPKPEQSVDEKSFQRKLTSISALCLVFFLLLALLAEWLPNGLVDETRSPIHANADMRTLGRALEDFYREHHAYPAWSLDPDQNAFGQGAKNNPNMAGQPTFMVRSALTGLKTLTTPVAYMSEYPKDPMAPTKGLTFSYFSMASGWILWSAGPDKTYDLSIENIKQAYDPNKSMPSAYLIERTYDPSNGSTSGGDIWRVKQ